MNKFILIALLSIIGLTYVNSFRLDRQGASNTECEICSLAVNTTEYLIKHENYTQSEVDAELKKICNIVPSNMTKECQLFMLITAPLITADLFKGESGEQICSHYGACPKSFESTVANLLNKKHRMTFVKESSVVSSETVQKINKIASNNNAQEKVAQIQRSVKVIAERIANTKKIDLN